MSTSAEANPAGQCPVHHGYEPFNLKDPFPVYAVLREEDPVMYDERIDHWVVTRYDDIKAVFEDWETFSSENAQAPVRPHSAEAKRIMVKGGFTAYSGLSARVPPEHTRIRSVVAKAFTPRRYKALEPTIRQNVIDLATSMTAEGNSGDLLTGVAYQLPTITILTLIGADLGMIDDYKRWSESRAAMTWGDLTDEEQIPHAHNLVEYWAECQRLVAEAHETHPDSLVGDLVRAQEQGDEITDHEIASVCYSLLFAGHETTTTLITNTFRMLLSYPEQWQTVIENPKAIPGAVDEVLRYSGSIVAWRRRALADAEVGGVPIPKGANLLLVMGSANRDPSKFDDPEVFDIARSNAREHLSFGFGIHYCLGNMLAKLQTRIAVEEIAALIPQLELVNPDGIEFAPNLSFRVPLALPVRWSEEKSHA